MLSYCSFSNLIRLRTRCPLLVAINWMKKAYKNLFRTEGAFQSAVKLRSCVASRTIWSRICWNSSSGPMSCFSADPTCRVRKTLSPSSIFPFMISQRGDSGIQSEPGRRKIDGTACNARQSRHWILSFLSKYVPRPIQLAAAYSYISVLLFVWPYPTYVTRHKQESMRPNHTAAFPWRRDFGLIHRD